MTTFRADLSVVAVLVLLLLSAVKGYTEDNPLLGTSRRDGDEGGAMSSSGEEEEEEGRRRVGVVSSSSGCEDGWLSTHNYCLLYTGLREEQAELYCAQRGALQVRGICLTKPSTLSEDAVIETRGESKEDVEETLPPSSSSSSSSWTGHQCPSGWAQSRDYCYFNPGPASKVCELLGARYVFNLCVVRVPHEIPGDFLHAVKRLHGDDNHLDRNARLCCCHGGGFCK